MIYPEHLYDPLRIDIATMFIQKRHRKLFPNMSDTELEKIDAQILQGARLTDEKTTRDFWDALYAYKLETARKYWVNYLTAENVQWEIIDEPIENIRLTWPRVGDPTLGELLGSAPYSSEQIMNALEANPDAKSSMLAGSDQHSQDTPDRDHYPIVGMRKDGKVHLEDGNRRALRAVLHDKKTVNICVGTMEGKEPVNYWVSTSWFWQLVLIASRDAEMHEATKSILQSIFAKSEAAKIVYTNSVSEGFFGERNPLAKELLK